jgi:hypothetical protein
MRDRRAHGFGDRPHRHALQPRQNVAPEVHAVQATVIAPRRSSFAPQRGRLGAAALSFGRRGRIVAGCAHPGDLRRPRRRKGWGRLALRLVEPIGQASIAILTASTRGLDDARLRRAQALLPNTEHRSAIARELLEAKIKGQLAVIGSFGLAGSDSVREALALLDHADRMDVALIPKVKPPKHIGMHGPMCPCSLRGAIIPRIIGACLACVDHRSRLGRAMRPIHSTRSCAAVQAESARVWR